MILKYRKEVNGDGKMGYEVYKPAGPSLPWWNLSWSSAYAAREQHVCFVEHLADAQAVIRWMADETL